MDAKKRYEDWLENPYFDENTKNELRRIADDEKEIEERFYKELEFGTGGLRGIIGAGTNRMNIYTVRKATQGLANFILKENAEKKKVWRSHLIPETCLWSSHRKQRSALRQMELKLMFFHHFVRHRCSRLHLEHLDVRQGS